MNVIYSSDDSGVAHSDTKVFSDKEITLSGYDIGLLKLIQKYDRLSKEEIIREISNSNNLEACLRKLNSHKFIVMLNDGVSYVITNNSEIVLEAIEDD